MKRRGILVALTNPVEGREDEYNSWYDNVHLADLLNVPGVTSARRFRLAPSQHIDAPTPWKYCATYEVDDADSVAKKLRNLRGPDGKGSANMVISPALAEERVAWFFEEIVERKK